MGQQYGGIGASILGWSRAFHFHNGLDRESYQTGIILLSLEMSCSKAALTSVVDVPCLWNRLELSDSSTQLGLVSRPFYAFAQDRKIMQK